MLQAIEGFIDQNGKLRILEKSTCHNHAGSLSPFLTKSRQMKLQIWLC